MTKKKNVAKVRAANSSSPSFTPSSVAIIIVPISSGITIDNTVSNLFVPLLRVLIVSINFINLLFQYFINQDSNYSNQEKWDYNKKNISNVFILFSFSCNF